jgi:hypothetical protein
MAMSKEPIHGSCLCGTVTYETEAEPHNFLYCFCSRCRKKTGSAHASNVFVEGAGFRWLSGEENVGQYALPGTNTLTNCFCKTCGSRVPRKTDQGVTIPAGGLDIEPELLPQKCIYWADKPDWYRSVDDLPKVEQSGA